MNLNILLSTDLTWGFVQDFLRLNKGTERTWLQLIRSCTLHLLWCPGFMKSKGTGGRIGAVIYPPPGVPRGSMQTERTPWNSADSTWTNTDSTPVHMDPHHSAQIHVSPHGIRISLGQELVDF